MRNLSGGSYFLLLIILATLAVVGLSLELRYFASKILPMLVGAAVFILAAVTLIREIRGRSNLAATVIAGDGGVEGTGEKFEFEGKGLLPVGAWIGGFTLAILLLGFVVATLFFTGAYMKQHGSSWRMSVLTTIVFTGIIHAVFNVALQADLTKGAIFAWLGF